MLLLAEACELSDTYGMDSPCEQCKATGIVDKSACKTMTTEVEPTQGLDIANAQKALANMIDGLDSYIDEETKTMKCTYIEMFRCVFAVSMPLTSISLFSFSITACTMLALTPGHHNVSTESMGNIFLR